MNFSLKPHPLIAHWVPGFVVSLIIFLWGPRLCLESMASNWNAINEKFQIFLGGLIAVVVPFVVGQVLDSIRDLIEGKLDDYCKIKWEFIRKMDVNDLKKFEEYYFTYYVFNSNLVIGIGLIVLPTLILTFIFSRFSLLALGVLLLALVAALILFCDAFQLRHEIKEYIEEWLNENKKKGSFPGQN